jgi:hypothetical protein
MNQPTLATRIEVLERKMEPLAGLPDRVASLELQIVQFRAEVREEFSAVRGEMRACEERLRGEIGACEQRLRLEMRALNSETLKMMTAFNEETRTHMRVLHEEVLARIALLGEGGNGRKRRGGVNREASRKRRSPKR